MSIIAAGTRVKVRYGFDAKDRGEVPIDGKEGVVLEQQAALAGAYFVGLDDGTRPDMGAHDWLLFDDELEVLK